MTSRKTSMLIGFICAGAWGAAGGCGSSEPQPTAMPASAPVRERAPAPPPAPAVTTIADLMAEMGIDKRVSLAEADAPGTDAQRRAILEFFDSFARGDATALRSMLSKLDADELDALVKSGAWETTTQYITNIDVRCGASPQGEACTLAVFYFDPAFSGDEFQPQLWYYTVENGERRFDAVAAPPNLMDRLYGDDWIAKWFEILQEELALADQPDQEIEIQQRDMSESSGYGGGGPSGPGVEPNPSSPSPGRPGPGGPGKRPKKSKRPAPGKGR